MRTTARKSAGVVGLFFILLYILAILGWCQCVYKMVKCNWEPIGKAEAIYTVGTFTGAGCIIGWIDVKDE